MLIIAVRFVPCYQPIRSATCNRSPCFLYNTEPHHSRSASAFIRVHPRFWKVYPSRDGRTRTDGSVLPRHVGLPLPHIPFVLTSASRRHRVRIAHTSIASGPGGARIPVSWASAKRYAISATGPAFRFSQGTKKARRLCDTGPYEGLSICGRASQAQGIQGAIIRHWGECTLFLQ